MSQIRCFLVDDEPPAIELLEKYISMIDQLEIVGTSLSAVKAFDMLKDSDVDLLFLDIQMPVLNGIEFLKTLSAPPAVILTTAYREYALDGYDLDIIDYLLKPIPFNRFLKAVDRYRNRSKPNPADASKIDKIPKHVFFNVNRTQHKIFLKDILYIESLKDYVRLHLRNDKLVIKGNLGSTLKQLPSDQFLRIHRSFAVARIHVRAFNQSEIEISDQRLPIGGSYRNEILKKLKQ